MGNSLNPFIQGQLAAFQWKQQLEQLLSARQGRELAQSAEERNAKLFPLKEQQEQLALQTGQLGLKSGQERLTNLQLQNQQLKRQLAAFADPSALDGLRKDIESIPDLTPEEKLGAQIALQESAQSLDLTPARSYVRDVILERGRERRSKRAQEELQNRLEQSITAADRRFFAGLQLREKQFQERVFTDEQAELAARQIAAGQATLKDYPQAQRIKIGQIAEKKDLLFLPPAVRQDISKLEKGKAVIERFKKTLEDFASDKSVKNAFRLSTQRLAFARPIGKGVFGEVGVFTDQDKEDFANILSPGGVPLAIFTKKPENVTNEEISLAFLAIQDLEGVVNDVQERTISSSFKTFRRTPPPSKDDLTKDEEQLLRDAGIIP